MKPPIYNQQEREVIKLNNTLFANFVRLDFECNRFRKHIFKEINKLFKLLKNI